MDTPPPSHNQKPTLEQLLRRGDVWRGHSQVFSPREAIAAGHAALDARLVNRGWPLGSLVEVCLPEAFKRDGCFGGEWLLLAPVVKTLCGSETFLILLNPPAQPFASGLIQAGVPLDQVLVIRAESRQDFIASFVELSRSQYCAILLAWQPRQSLSYTELRKCQLACAEQQGLYFLLRSHKNKTQSSPAPLRLLLQLQAESLRLEVFKQKGKFNSGVALLPLPQNWLPQTAHRNLGGSVFRPAIAVAGKPGTSKPNSQNIAPNIVPIRPKPRLKRGHS